MNGEILFALLIGHCIGDYLLQSSSMAIHKKDSGAIGWVYCTSHCLVYTYAVMAMLSIGGAFTSFNEFWLTYPVIFLSHIIIDRTNIIEWWLGIIGSRSWNTHINLQSDNLTTRESIALSFGSIVYVVADNTVHLFLMYISLKIILGGGM